LRSRPVRRSICSGNGMARAIEDRILEDGRRMHALADRCRTDTPPDELAVEQALERGFASLIDLEAQLRRAQRGTGDEPSRQENELLRGIEALRAAITELRRHTMPERSAAFTSGFVLPADS
jgi:hypothetical protein